MNFSDTGLKIKTRFTFLYSKTDLSWINAVLSHFAETHVNNTIRMATLVQKEKSNSHLHTLEGERSTSRPRCTRCPLTLWGTPLDSDRQRHSCMCTTPACHSSLRSPLAEVRHIPQLEEKHVTVQWLQRRTHSRHRNKWCFRGSLHLHRQARVHPSLYSCTFWFPGRQADTW